MTTRPSRILIEAAAERGWMVSFDHAPEAPIAAALTDDWDLMTYLCGRLGVPMPAVQERPAEPESEKRLLPKVFRGGKP
jgi:hypothetical protein